MLNVKTLPVGELEANCFIVSDSEQNAVIIDPGSEAGYILDALRQNAVKPLAILLTHGHIDHFGAAAEVQRQTGVPIYVHPLDEPMLHSPQICLADSLGMADLFDEPEGEIHPIADGDVLKFTEELTFTVLHTPGHTPGGCCFRHEDILFSGDTLFRDGVGRVDFPGGNIRDMRASLYRLGALEGDCTVYCGHYGSTTLEHERTCGHYLTPRTFT
ncbi:MAG TPA: hypothetical protein DDX71_01415 [Ruminococcus sp.]|nr:hypothetical protein [Ruminococcus sp.]